MIHIFHLYTGTFPNAITRNISKTGYDDEKKHDRKASSTSNINVNINISSDDDAKMRNSGGVVSEIKDSSDTEHALMADKIKIRTKMCACPELSKPENDELHFQPEGDKLHFSDYIEHRKSLSKDMLELGISCPQIIGDLEDGEIDEPFPVDFKVPI